MSSNPNSLCARQLSHRELSWLEFNQRVLNEAQNPKKSLLERVKFFCITSFQSGRIF